MLDKSDAQWWILEAEKHPEAAPDLIRMLADRLAFLDRQNEELRAEVTTLRRRIRGEVDNVEVSALQRRIQELEDTLRRGGNEQRLLIYSADRIFRNAALAGAATISHPLPADVRLTICSPAAALLVITAESRAFTFPASALPIPDDRPATLGNPRDIAAMIDRAAFERCRFLLLLSQRGYVYSLLAGSITSISARQEKLIRSLIPGDPIVAAIPAHNADLFGISTRGRWTRFPERSIAGAGSQVMELASGDTLAGIVSLPPEGGEIAFLTAENRIFLRAVAEFPARKAPGAAAGTILKGQTIIGAGVGYDFAILTQQGNVVNVSLRKLRDAALSEGGIPIPGLPTGDTPLTFAAY